MAKKAKQKEAANEENNSSDLIAQAEKLSPGITAEIESANKASVISGTKRDNDKKRKTENHLQREYDIDVQGSFKASLKNCLDEKGNINETKLSHLQSVLTAGPGKYDR
jgi:hypothetical protein